VHEIILFRYIMKESPVGNMMQDSSPIKTLHDKTIYVKITTGSRRSENVHIVWDRGPELG
jgi:hypothetical protein